MGLIASIYARVSQHDAIRTQMLAHLFLARVHNSVKSSYERYLASSSSSGECESQHYVGQRRVRVTNEESNQQQQQQHPTRFKQRGPNEESQEGDDEPNTRAAEAAGWDWRGFPGLWRPLAVYDYFSTCWMSYAFLRTIFQEQLNVLVGPLSRWLLDGRPGNCLLMGRMAKPSSLNEYMTAFLTSWHLSWRYVQAHFNKCNHLITMIVFLLASERDLERVYALIESESVDMNMLEEEYADRPASSRTPTTLLARPISHLSWASVQQQHQPPPQPSLSNQASESERLFRQVMCYQVYCDGQRVHFRLRPNRTRGARKLLEHRVATVSVVAIIFFGMQFIIATIIISLSVFSDYRYARDYPGCYPLLDDRLARGELGYFSSITMREHRAWSLAVDILETIIIWVDSGLALTFGPATTYLLNYDLLLYWSELNRKLESLVRRSKEQVPSLVFSSRHLVGAGKSPTEPSSPPSPSRIETTKLALERDIHELQFQMLDFFHQVRRVDLIVGDTLTHAIAIWLSFFAFVNYNLLTNKEFSLHMSFVIELLLSLGFFIITLASYYLLQLRKRCLKSYRSLCSLMAHDQTSKKRSFITLLDFYMGTHNATTYHLFRTYAYEPTTFITIIGWSFSCFFIAFTLFKPHS